MKISKQVAKGQLEKLLSYYDYDLNELDKAQQGYADKVKRGILKGRLEVQEGGKVIQTLIHPLGEKEEIKTLEYRPAKGSDKHEMDEFGADEHNKRAQALMGALSGRGLTLIEELEGPDLTYMENLGILFLQL